MKFITKPIAQLKSLRRMSLRKWQAIYVAAGIALLPAAPLLYLQGRITRWKVGVLPYAKDPEGVSGEGDGTVSLLVIGESTVAGLGARTHKQALAGRFGYWLGKHLGKSVRWRAIGKNGVTASETLKELVPLIEPRADFDYILVGLGGNDVLKLTSPKRFRRDIGELLSVLRRRFPQAVIFISNCPMIKYSPVLPQPVKGILWQLSKMHDANMRDLVSQLDRIYYYPQPAGFETDGFFADGIHPSEKGYDDWARAMVDYFAECLRR